jgi:UDP-N-acetylglucosamine--N-acetylmuramyl-(pentapeptide) pyrophosphoryl-undecaprenol N-acetylglucosamine transferase
MRVVVSGGGTGGHIFPALAVVESLRRLRRDAELLYIGGSTGMETQIVPERGVPFQAVTAKKLRRVLSPSTLGVLVSLFKGYREARTYLKAFRAEAVVSTGGYVAAAATLAGAHLGLPTVIVAPDLLPGRTNRLLARSARRICVTFEQTLQDFPAGRTVITGMPLRAGVVAPQNVTPREARAQFAGLCPDRFTVLVTGGSQGARALNRVVLETVPALLAAGAQVLHQAGANNIEAVREQAAELLKGNGYCSLAFLDEAQMPLARRAADVILCRGGISTLSENLLCGLPAIVVPLPTAYADHQSHNAAALAAAGAVLHRPEALLTAQQLAGDLLALWDDTPRHEEMARAARALARPDAADAVAREVITLLDRH